MRLRETTIESLAAIDVALSSLRSARHGLRKTRAVGAASHVVAALRSAEGARRRMYKVYRLQSQKARNKSVGPGSTATPTPMTTVNAMVRGACTGKHR